MQRILKMTVKTLKTGLIFRNSQPHVKSIHAYFPSVVPMANGEMLASIVLGEAFEAVNLRTHICRSSDNGETWTHEGPIYPGTKDRLTSDCARLTALSDGEVVAFMIRHVRSDHPNEGLTSPETLGFVPTELMLARSKDYGRSWDGPKPFTSPIVGPSFEMCSPITALKNGGWILSTETWPEWNGDCPNGIKMIGLVSNDRGQSWPMYVDVMNEAGKKVYFWESKIVELTDGRLLAVAWVYDDEVKKDRQNHYALSSDGGKHWSTPASMGIWGQTLTPLVLKDGRILTTYRRMDKLGLWANLSHLEGERWVNDLETPLWGNQTVGLTSTSENMSHNFNVLRFGAPCMTHLSDGTVFVAFWCYEDCVSNVRWFKLKVE
jgi:hypothetical protein